MVLVLSRSREFSLFWMVPVSVPEKIGPGTGKNGPGKKYWSRYRKKLVPKKSTGTGTGINCGYHHTLL